MRGLAWIDLTAEGARAWVRTSELPQSPLLLDPPHAELALAARVEGRRLVFGRTAWEQRCSAPHLSVGPLLPSLGTATSYELGRRRFAVDELLRLLLQGISQHLGANRRLLLSVPGYLRPEQVRLLRDYAAGLGLELLGLLARELLFGMEAASMTENEKLELLLLDVDEHAFTATVLRPTAGDLRQTKLAATPSLGRRVWRERLLQAVALQCIAKERRDPRAIPTAEQALVNQSAAWFQALGAGEDMSAECYLTHRALPLRVKLTPGEAASHCADLLGAAGGLAQQLHGQMVRPQSGGMLFLTPAAAELPGLVARLYQATGHRLLISVLGKESVATALGLAESVAEKERLPIDFAARAVSLPLAEFTFDAPPVLAFPGEVTHNATAEGG